MRRPTVSNDYIEDLYKGADGCEDLTTSTKRTWTYLSLLKINKGIWLDSQTYQLLLFGGFIMEKKIFGKYQKRLTLLGQKFIKEFSEANNG